MRGGATVQGGELQSPNGDQPPLRLSITISVTATTSPVAAGAPAKSPRPTRSHGHTRFGPSRTAARRRAGEATEGVAGVPVMADGASLCGESRCCVRCVRPPCSSVRTPAYYEAVCRGRAVATLRSRVSNSILRNGQFWVTFLAKEQKRKLEGTRRAKGGADPRAVAPEEGGRPIAKRRPSHPVSAEVIHFWQQNQQLFVFVLAARCGRSIMFGIICTVSISGHRTKTNFAHVPLIARLAGASNRLRAARKKQPAGRGARAAP